MASPTDDAPPTKCVSHCPETSTDHREETPTGRPGRTTAGSDGTQLTDLIKWSNLTKIMSNPLFEVFGFPTDNHSEEAERLRNNRICPYGNSIPNCTKDRANDPLGVCSVRHGGDAVITCPVRFREKWLIAEDASKFFFAPGTRWTTLKEVRLKDAYGVSAGNIDVVLVSYDDRGKLIDFGSLEIQAVYISGNIRNPYARYMSDPIKYSNLDWSKEKNYPRADFLSSSRKRLAPQLLFKGGILHSWNKKSAVALDRPFFQTLPKLAEVAPEDAEICWMVYDLKKDQSQNRYELKPYKKVYTKFNESISQITIAKPGNIEDFMKLLQSKLDETLDNESSNLNRSVILEDFL